MWRYNMNNNTMEELNALLEASKEVELNDEFEKTPDGEYEGVIDKCEFTESKSSGNLMFKMELIITGPKYAKKHEWKYYVLNKPENMKRLTTDLEKFGINCTSMKTIGDSLESLLDVPVSIIIKTSEPKEEGKEGCPKEERQKAQSSFQSHS